MDDLSLRMDGAIEALRKEFSGLRTGRASTALLDHVTVEAYGTKMPMSQVGSVNVPEPRMLTVQVWDNSLVKEAEKAIRDADLGLNPQTEGNLIRVPLPDLSEERRVELTKVAAKFGEQARIAVRNVRRDGLDNLKKQTISNDELRDRSGDIQKLTDEYIDIINGMVSNKSQEILQC